MFETVKKRNYLSVNLLIKKGMNKRRRLVAAAISNVAIDKVKIKVIK